MQDIIGIDIQTDRPRTFRLSGRQQSSFENDKAGFRARLPAAVFIFLVLASRFGSFLQPAAIMAALPLALVIWASWWAARRSACSR